MPRPWKAATLCLGALYWTLAALCGCTENDINVRPPQPPVAPPAATSIATDAKSSPETVAPAATTAAVKIGPMTVYRSASSDKGKHAVEGRAEVDAVLCMDKGILDFLVVPRDSGKEYETLLRMEAQPSELHAALLALGARPGPLPPELRGDNRGAPESAAAKSAPEKTGDRVEISVRWGEPGHEREGRVEEWLTDRATGKTAKGLSWVFSGSFFGKYPDGKEVYVGDVERLAVAVWYHAACVLNLGVAAGSPYRGEHLGFEINRAAVPPVGTPVRIIFRIPQPAPDANRPKS